MMIPGSRIFTRYARSSGTRGCDARRLLHCGERLAQPLCMLGEHFGLLPFARRRLQGHPGFSRNDVDMQVEHDLAARAIFCVTCMTWQRSSGATSRMLRAWLLGMTRVWPGERGMMSRNASDF